MWVCSILESFRNCNWVYNSFSHKHDVRELLKTVSSCSCSFLMFFRGSEICRAIKRSNCFHASGGKDPCPINSNPYMIAFGIVEIILSQIPDFDQLWWLSIVAAVMSFTYSAIGLGLGVSRVAGKFSDISVPLFLCSLMFCLEILTLFLFVLETGKIKGNLTGISSGTATQSQKVWRNFQALGDIAFAYSYSMILIEIQVRFSRRSS